MSKPLTQVKYSLGPMKDNPRNLVWYGDCMPLLMYQCWVVGLTDDYYE
jgi:hypothetical protein